ncbi:hypothetical protein JI664_12730 [Rhodobacter sp. NTK016B]|uniref:transcription termination/antitermination NusG family protein n=1 Tax=Rhodobacter sp. NTK016B TaxID=2759676 RepID=UPI001A8E816A|nr:transcription termination/antitermination NusG family protein [Rhodobacter sp. NTK016B]MBN8292832.1 hypothetical protein [Rhodobacter sp. NTK016B]
MTMHSSYFIGQVIQPEPTRPIQVGDIGTPTWYAFLTTPQKEGSAKAWLEKKGVEAWYPTETRWRKIAKGKIKRKEYEAVLVPRYIFARFTGRPQWDLLKASRWLTGVVGIDGVPLPITDETLAAMEQVPARLAEIRAREEERRTIRPGDRVRIRDGAMEGWVVEVRSIHAGIARFIVPLMGDRETEMQVGRLSKQQ